MTLKIHSIISPHSSSVSLLCSSQFGIRVQPHDTMLVASQMNGMP